MFTESIVNLERHKFMQLTGLNWKELKSHGKLLYCTCVSLFRTFACLTSICSQLYSYSFQLSMGWAFSWAWDVNKKEKLSTLKVYACESPTFKRICITGEIEKAETQLSRSTSEWRQRRGPRSPDTQISVNLIRIIPADCSLRLNATAIERTKGACPVLLFAI